LKKLLIILLMLVYAFSSTGATIHLHYCCGKLDKVSLSTQHNDDCPKQESAQKNCCKSKQVDLKIKADQDLLAKWIATHKDLGTTKPTAHYEHLTPLSLKQLKTFTTGPPLHAVVPLFIQYCVYRI
jgi:hypothetical protein